MDAMRNLFLHELRIGPTWQLRKSEESAQETVVDVGTEMMESTVAVDLIIPLPSEVSSVELTWSDLGAQLGKCQACPARDSAQAPQLGRGSLHPKVLVVGEFLNEQEHAGDSVYLGKPGELLINMLASIDLTLDVDVFVCKSVRCFSATNEFSDAEKENCVKTCAHFLQKQVDLLQPQLILCLGRKASISLMGVEFAETAKRAQVYDYQGIPLILSLPSETLLAQAKYKREAWVDLCLLKSLLD